MSYMSNLATEKMNLDCEEGGCAMTDRNERLWRIGALCMWWLLSMLVVALASDSPIAGRALVVTIGLSTIYGGVLAVGIIGVWQGRL